MSNYVLAAEVPADLAEIWRHIAQDDLDAADRVIDTISQAFIKLAELPGMGYRRSDLEGKALRVWPVFSYLIIYRVQIGLIEIVRVISGYRDIAALSIQ